MRNLLAFLAALIITLVGVGLYLDWFKVRSTPGDGGKKNINVEFDTTKIADDIHRGAQKVKGVIQSLGTKGGEEAAEKGAVTLPATPPVEPR